MARGPKKRWADADLIAAVPQTRSMAATCRALGLSPAGSNHLTIKGRIRALGLSTAHWTGSGWARGLTGINTRQVAPLDDLLRSEPLRGTNRLRLKRRLIDAGIIGPGCQGEGCGITEWLGRPLSLQLDHINGDRNDWRRENIRLLCPNCHAQTDTYCGRNTGTRQRQALRSAGAA